MEILLANPRGFCAGVNMAIECLTTALRTFGPPLYVYHEIVHNSHVVERFRRQGATFVDHVSDVPRGAVLLFSAHGVSRTVREEAAARGLRTIDATCPLVMKVHLEAVRFAREGYSLVLIGHEGHDEVIGTMGEVPGGITLVQTPDDVDRLPLQPHDKLAYLTQTTLSIADAQAIIDRLKARYPRIVAPAKDDICYATTNRQEAVGTLIPLADVLIVVGSRNSSNSQRLKELGDAWGTPSHLIDHHDELRPEWFQAEPTVLVTAGASAPEDVVQQCVKWLQDRFGAVVRECEVKQEHVSFPLPIELRQLQTTPQ